MGRQFWIDTIVGSLFIFGLLALLYVAFSQNKVLKPITNAIADFEVTDVVISQLRDDPTVDERIVLVNTANLPRDGIADQIRILKRYNPKVIGLDVNLSQEGNMLRDMYLAETLQETENVVLCSQLYGFDKRNSNFTQIRLPLDDFRNGFPTGFTNLFSDDIEEGNFETIRKFPTQRTIDGKPEYSFAHQIVKVFDPEKAERLIERNNPYEIINFRGNIYDPFGKSTYSGMFYVLDAMDVLEDNFSEDLIEGKIVIMGFMGRNLGDTNWNHKLYTPLNVNYAGKSNPDMYSSVVQANIIAMILNEDYINGFGNATAMVLALIIGYLNIVVFSLVYYKIDLFYDAATVTIQFFELTFLLILTIISFAFFNYKMNFTLAIIIIAFAGDGMEVFFGFFKNLFSEETYKVIEMVRLALKKSEKGSITGDSGHD